jgi:pilus assembly protein Flp/PilA
MQPASRRKRVVEGGATAVEYALMVSLVALVIIGAVTLLGQNVGSLFDSAASAI